MTSKVWDVMNDLEMVTSKIVSAREIIDTAAEAIQRNEYDKAETLAMAAYEFLGYYLQEFDEKFKLAWKETVKKQDIGFEVDTTLDDCMPPWGHSDLEYLIKHREPVSCDKDDPSPECKGAWNSFWEENYYPEEKEETKVDGYSVNGESHSKYYYEYDRNDPNRPNPFSKKTLTYDEAVAAGWEMTADGFWWPPQEKKKWVLPVEQVHDDYFVSFPDDLLEAANLKEGDTVEWVDKGDGSYLLRKVTKPLGMDEC